jgi:leucyl/phenylalanyl-tRNA--protein transferase
MQDWQLVLALYAEGRFPMADGRRSRVVRAIEPETRAVFPLDAFRVPSRLARTIRRGGYTVSIDTAPAEVIGACAVPAPGRRRTWINDWIITTYADLATRGHVHTVEVRRGDDLIGGLYGVALGAAFFGESMFSRSTDASKIALVHLVSRLRRTGFALLDAQMPNPHLAQFGLVEMTQQQFVDLLRPALALPPPAFATAGELYGAQLLQSITQTS